MKLTIFSVGVMISGAIMFSIGALDVTGNTWQGWTFSLQQVGGALLIGGILLGLCSLKEEIVKVGQWIKKEFN
ncbi:hypothetical protein CS063_08465 [Sporanaerobium hydrogeniformans]|uniref:Uncharacterized protein n=1 Tax=Sporanaerobium hydrogeniformans TaxID=3072179 RepID=A0AC61DDM7_9FIRM|nr:hypothetical protein [Sporanaerobium hydrogeniformans]PHV70791.1 hypothetical protein CS063_08465 [Sporanaerobium hydrogeniformans]